MADFIKKQVEKFKKKSLVSKIFDIAFYILIILLIIPGTRKPVMSKMIQVISISPSTNKRNIEKLDDSAYQWILRNSEGEIVQLKDYKNEIVIINLWATWCPPCIGEMPSFIKLYNDYGDKINFLFVTNENPEKVNAFLTKKEYDIPVYYNRKRIPEILYSESIPATHVINKKGELVVSKKGAANWNAKKFRKLLDQLLLE